MSIIKKINNWIFSFPHNTENDVLNIKIIQSKDHQHLITKIRNIETIYDEELTKEEVIEKIKQFLEVYSKEEINYHTDKNLLKEKLNQTEIKENER